MKTDFKVCFDRITKTIITDVSVRRADVSNAVNNTVSADIIIRALWDTGAGMSVLSETMVKKLGLTAIDLWRIIGIGGTIVSNRYDISVTLPNKVTFPIVRVAEWDGNQRYDMLIGMDIISRGNFSIINDTGKTVFSFKV